MPFVQHTGTSTGTASATSIGVTLNSVASGNLLWVAVGVEHATTTVVVADGGNTWQAGPTLSNAGDPYQVRLFYAENVTGGNRTVTATFGNSASYRAIYVQERSGLATSGAYEGGSSLRQTTGTTRNAGTYSNTGAGELVAIGMDFFTNSTPTVGSGFTARAAQWQFGLAGNFMLPEDATYATAGSRSATFGMNSGAVSYCLQMFFLDASGGSSQGIDPSLLSGAASIGSHTVVSVVAGTISPGLLPSAAAIGAHTLDNVVALPQEIDANLLGSAAAFGSHLIEVELDLRSIGFYGTGTGDDDRIKIPRNGGQPANIGATDFTIELWLRPAVTGNNGGAITPGSGYLWITGNTFFDCDVYNRNPGFGASLTVGRVTFGVKNQSGIEETWRASTDIRDGQWHHVAITRNVSTGAVQIYVDGTREVNDASGPTGSISYQGGTPIPEGVQGDAYIVLGAEKHDADAVAYPSFTGRMAEVRLSNSIRYAGSSAAVPSAPFSLDGNTLALYHFDELSGTLIIDTAGNRSPGTLMTGATREDDSPFVDGITTTMLASAAAFGDHGFSNALQTIEVDTLVSAASIGSHSIANASAQAISPSQLASAAMIGAHEIASIEQLIAMSRLSSAAWFPPVTLSGGVVAEASGGGFIIIWRRRGRR